MQTIDMKIRTGVFLLSLLSLHSLFVSGLAGCADDADDDAPRQERPAGPPYDYDYGVDPTDYPEECRFSSNLFPDASKKVSIEPGSNVIELRAFTRCREQLELCNELFHSLYRESLILVYGEEGTGIRIEPPVTSQLAGATFVLRKDGEEIRRKDYRGSHIFLQPEDGEFWTDESFTLEVTNPSEHTYELRIIQESVAHYIGMSCVEEADNGAS